MKKKKKASELHIPSWCPYHCILKVIVVVENKMVTFNQHCVIDKNKASFKECRGFERNLKLRLMEFILLDILLLYWCLEVFLYHLTKDCWDGHVAVLFTNYIRAPCFTPNLRSLSEDSFSHSWWSCVVFAPHFFVFKAVVLGLRLDLNIINRISQQQTQNQHEMLLKCCHL